MISYRIQINAALDKYLEILKEMNPSDNPNKYKWIEQDMKNMLKKYPR